MRTIILGFEKRGDETPKAVGTTASSQSRGEFYRMKRELEGLPGCGWNELWNSERGTLDWFECEPKKKESKVKSKIFGLMLALMAFSLTANAENYPGGRYGPTALTIPTVAAGGTSNSVAAVIDVRHQSDVAIHWRTGSTNVTVRISGSVDGSTFDTNRYVLQLGYAAGDGTALGTTVTNLAIGAVGYLRIDSVLSTGTVNATNTVYYGAK